ncbi:hypothetical protein [Pseudomonas sp. St316]|uniref:hypothetical protein n=1 Tax=Pseudomonas sp. St316 TaxID=2678257 RepID=UPI001BB41DA1|nr:hypothetical protein [Pseudomonas sp. St316]
MKNIYAKTEMPWPDIAPAGLRPVGAVECNEAAMSPLPIESKAKDLKIATFGSSCRV